MNVSRCSIRSGATGLFALALALFAPTALSSDIMRVDGAPVISTKAEEVVSWRAASNIRNATAVTFMPLPASALKALQEENSPDPDVSLDIKPLKIGVNRNADTEINAVAPFALNWQNVGGGYVARLAITSPEAKAMRVALRLRALPDVAELRFSGSGAPERIIGVISGKEANALRDDNKVYWTPVTEGETQNIEIYLPSPAKTEDVKIRLNGASHLFTSAREGFSSALVTKVSAYCQVDVACKYGSLGAAFQNVSRAVARMTFTDRGGTYTCTGTLLNDASSSQTPYFWSAAHCLNTQSVANTLNTHWFEDAADCGSFQKNPDYRQLPGGAQLLHQQVSTDTLLLRLNNTPPAGAFFSGWDATYFSDGAFIGIHHPRGDTKKVSTGNGAGAACNTRFETSDIPGLDLSRLSMVSWEEGIVESGSSGSGLFTLSDGSYRLRGGLMGSAPTACWQVGLPPGSSNNASCYFNLHLVYDSIRQYLGDSNPTPGAGSNTTPVFVPTRNYNGQWIRDVNEMGWGLTVLMGFSDQRYIFVPWYTYDSSGKAAWYLFQGPAEGYGDWTANDTFEASVYRYTGSPWHAMPWNNSAFNEAKVGTAKLTFTSATTAKFEYDVEGAKRSINLNKIP
ncbi:MAG: hypothetical protein FWC38_10090 [Proteobacteria bacterium]|nr:hypothetical protein [Pseudomonadota bacterium]MCL2308546.1 hypothetical protein [Pseudomonadota bacterium]